MMSHIINKIIQNINFRLCCEDDILLGENNALRLFENKKDAIKMSNRIIENLTKKIFVFR